MAEEPQFETFAERLDHLFRTRWKPGTTKEWTTREVAAATKLSHSHVGKLRSGGAPDPRLTEMQALADFFGVPLSYLAEGRMTPEQDREPESVSGQDRLRLAIRQPGVQMVALRMAEAGLSREGVEAVAAMIEHVAVLEAAARKQQPRRSEGKRSGKP